MTQLNSIKKFFKHINTLWGIMTVLLSVPWKRSWLPTEPKCDWPVSWVSWLRTEPKCNWPLSREALVINHWAEEWLTYLLESSRGCPLSHRLGRLGNGRVSSARPLRWWRCCLAVLSSTGHGAQSPQSTWCSQCPVRKTWRQLGTN